MWVKDWSSPSSRPQVPAIILWLNILIMFPKKGIWVPFSPDVQTTSTDFLDWCRGIAAQLWCIPEHFFLLFCMFALVLCVCLCTCNWSYSLVAGSRKKPDFAIKHNKNLCEDIAMPTMETFSLYSFTEGISLRQRIWFSFCNKPVNYKQLLFILSQLWMSQHYTSAEMIKKRNVFWSVTHS